MRHLLPVLILLAAGLDLTGCAGTTLVQRQHHLLRNDSSSVSVCFMRPSGEGFLGMMGVRGKPIEIDLDGEDLLSLSVGEYTFLDLRQGKYAMTVKSQTISDDNKEVETSRYFEMVLAGADSVYLLFTVEPVSFGDVLSRGLSREIDNLSKSIAGEFDTLSVKISGVTLLFSPADDPAPASTKNAQPLGGYAVALIGRLAAREAASELEPVEGAQPFPSK